MCIRDRNNGGLADMLYMGVKLGIYPPLIFLGIGTMTDFAPLISNPCLLYTSGRQRDLQQIDAQPHHNGIQYRGAHQTAGNLLSLIHI